MKTLTEMLSKGPVTVTQIVKGTGLTVDDVSDQLADLVDAGQVTKIVAAPTKKRGRPVATRYQLGQLPAASGPVVAA